jgi:anti-anti-sigma factor
MVATGSSTGPQRRRDDRGGASVAVRHRLDRGVSEGTARLAVTGEIDMGVAGEFRDALAAALALGVLAVREVDHVVVDFSALRFMDACCVGVLIAARREADRRGVAMVVVGAGGMPRRVLEILGVYERLSLAGHV